MKSCLAGHEFSDDSIDSYCIKPKDISKEQCFATRSFLFEATESNVNQHGIAHISYLTKNEYDEIDKERKAYKEYCEKLMDNLRSVVGG